MITNKLIYRLLAVQIVPFWEAIKYACAKTDELDIQDLPYHFNSLLHDLLSDKAQCFVVLTEERVLQAILTTRIVVDKVLLRKELFIRNMYSMQALGRLEFQELRNLILAFAEKEECKAITFNSRNPRVWEIAQQVGASERYRSFIYRV